MELVGGLEHYFFCFHSLGNRFSQLIIISFGGFETTNQLRVSCCLIVFFLMDESMDREISMILEGGNMGYIITMG